MSETPKLIIATTRPGSIFLDGLKERAITLIEGKTETHSNDWMTWGVFEASQARLLHDDKERQLYYNQLLGDQDAWNNTKDEKP